MRHFLPLATGVIAAEPERFAGVTAVGLATGQFVLAAEALMEHLRFPLAPAA